MKKLKIPIVLFFVLSMTVGLFLAIAWGALGREPRSIFSSIGAIKKYAAQMDEYPPSDNTTWANPNYGSFLRTTVPTLAEFFLYRSYLQPWPLWHAAGFKQLLAEVTDYREGQGYVGRFVIKMRPSVGSTFIIWGDVQGAFHSQIRVLVELFRQGIIDESLTIMKPHVYFVFNGDLINRSAYSLEALTIVLRLMKQNPERVFYMRGNHEDNEHWKNFNLKQDLIIRASRVSDEQIPLNTQVSSFFDTLPLALYLIADEAEDTMNLVRISHYGRDQIELEEQAFSGFFDEETDQDIGQFKLSNKIEPSKKNINVRAIIRGENRSTVYRLTPGLVQLEADKGATAWTILSSPTESYRHLQDFYYDAFVALDVGKMINDWTITLYNQDVRERLGFKRVATYNLLTGLREFRKKIDTHAQVLAFQQRLKQAQQEIDTLQETCPAAQQVLAQEP